VLSKCATIHAHVPWSRVLVAGALPLVLLLAHLPQMVVGGVLHCAGTPLARASSCDHGTILPAPGGNVVSVAVYKSQEK